MTALERALELHGEAVRDYLAAARRLSERGWTAPRADGKWSPAEITAHLLASYDIVIDELDGRAGMRVVTHPVLRLFLRWFVLRRILKTGAFPKGVPAPRETRPGPPEPDPGAGLAAFEHRAETFDRRIRETAERDPDKRLTHAYLGSAGLADAVVVCARHVQHHRAQLPARDP